MSSHTLATYVLECGWWAWRSIRLERFCHELDVCWRMLTFADVCWRMLTHAGDGDEARAFLSRTRQASQGLCLWTWGHLVELEYLFVPLKVPLRVLGGTTSWVGRSGRFSTFFLTDGNWSIFRPWFLFHRLLFLDDALQWRQNVKLLYTFLFVALIGINKFTFRQLEITSNLCL